MKTRIIQNEPEQPAYGAQTVEATVSASAGSSDSFWMMRVFIVAP